MYEKAYYEFTVPAKTTIQNQSSQKHPEMACRSLYILLQTGKRADSGFFKGSGWYLGVAEINGHVSLNVAI